MFSVGVLVLHYLDINVTEKCIESLMGLENDGIDLHILIVDNASPNGSGEKLKRKYICSKNIDILLLKETTGFSYGNNMGFQYLKNHFNLDFLIVANNDIVFIQPDFLKKIISIYEKEKYYLLGPDVFIPKRNYHDNPHYTNLRDKEFVIKRIHEMEFKLKVPLGRSLIRELFWSSDISLVYAKLLYPYSKKGKENYKRAECEQNDCCISGSCIIFSRLFLDINEKIFFPETEFYWEEEILFYKCKKNNWKILYHPLVKVIHEESIATKGSWGNAYRRRKNKLEKNIQSAKIYLSFINDK